MSNLIEVRTTSGNYHNVEIKGSNNSRTEVVETIVDSPEFMWTTGKWAIRCDSVESIRFIGNDWTD